MKELQAFIEEIKSSLATDKFIKITCSKPRKGDSQLTNLYIRRIILKNTPQLSFTYRYKTNDQTKNFTYENSLTEINRLLLEDFSITTLFTIEADNILKFDKQNIAILQKLKPSLKESESITHDRIKIKRAENATYLTLLGITDEQGKVIPKMADKYKQINKYLEIVESLISSSNLPENINIVDMGSGKGYLTFALYDYLKNKANLNITVTGIELRKELVDYCNDIAKQCNFESLHFVCQPIEAYRDTKIDILIALHACDTATDDAIYKGITSNASLIICAPCCHKQIRQQVKGIEQESPLLKYGIFQERQFEMITDTIRALILENHQYQSKIFEFISNEHTRKNILLVGIKASAKTKDETISKKIDSIKAQYHIEQHYLETLLTEK